MAVDYILTKAVNMPEQFPFWSSVVPQVTWSYQTAAGASVTYAITPTAGSWYIFGSFLVNYHSIVLNGTLYQVGEIQTSFSLSSIIEYPNSFTITATNADSTNARDVALHYSAFVLGTKKLIPKAVEKPKKRKPIVSKLPSNISKLKKSGNHIYLAKDVPVYKIDNKVYSSYSDFIEAENLLFLYHLYKQNQKTAIDEVAERYQIDLNVVEDLYSQHQSNKDLLALFENKIKEAKL